MAGIIGRILPSIGGAGISTIADGSVGAPGLPFTNDADTGLFRPAANSIGLACGSVERARVTSAGLLTNGLTALSGSVITCNNQLTMPDGTAAAPTLTFASDTNTGIFRVSENVGGLAANGVVKAGWDSGGIRGDTVSAYSLASYFITLYSGITYQSAYGDGATTVAHIFKTANAYVTVGAKLVSVRNLTTEKWHLTKDGIPGHSQNSTGAGTPLLGVNCPAVDATTPYTWLHFYSSDGSLVYVPAWK